VDKHLLMKILSAIVSANRDFPENRECTGKLTTCLEKLSAARGWPSCTVAIVAVQVANGEQKSWVERRWEANPTQRELHYDHTLITAPNLSTLEFYQQGRCLWDVTRRKNQATSWARTSKAPINHGEVRLWRLALGGWWLSKQAFLKTHTDSKVQVPAILVPLPLLHLKMGCPDKAIGKEIKVLAWTSEPKQLWLHHFLKTELSSSQNFSSEPGTGAKHWLVFRIQQALLGLHQNMHLWVVLLCFDLHFKAPRAFFCVARAKKHWLGKSTGKTDGKNQNTKKYFRKKNGTRHTPQLLRSRPHPIYVYDDSKIPATNHCLNKFFEGLASRELNHPLH
jgi:hypothetical protein